jgi:hypothetical protein
MRLARICSLAFIIFSVSQFIVAQQTGTSDAQATLLLRKAVGALVSSGTLNDVTLSGTARRIAGSDDDTGTAVFKALASGAGRTDLSLSSGQRSEVCDLSSTPAGAWSGPDRISHPIAFHNLLSEPAWFFPAFAIGRRLTASGYVAAYVGHETHNGQAVEHISVSQVSSAQFPPSSPLLQRLTQVEFFLHSATLLPTAITFNIHPDNDAGLDIPVEVRFSDYRTVNGARVPYHVQKYLNNTLTLDFQADSVTFNAGLSATDFNLP